MLEPFIYVHTIKYVQTLYVGCIYSDCLSIRITTGTYHGIVFFNLIYLHIQDTCTFISSNKSHISSNRYIRDAIYGLHTCV